MLTTIWIDGNYQCNMCSSGIAYGVDGYHHRHKMIIHRKNMLIFTFIHPKRIMVFYILKNKYVLTADTFQYFSLKFTVCKIGKTSIHFKSGNANFFNLVIFM